MNNKYGFSITFPETWSSYRFRESSNFVWFGIKDQDNVFVVSVYTKEEWKALEEEFKDDGPMPMKLKGKDRYVYSYEKSQDFSEAVMLMTKDIQSILSTLQLQK